MTKKKKKIEGYCQLQPLRRDFCPRFSHPLTLVQLAPTKGRTIRKLMGGWGGEVHKKIRASEN